MMWSIPFGALVFLLLWPLSLYVAAKQNRSLTHTSRLPDVGHAWLPDLTRWKTFGDVLAPLSLVRALYLAPAWTDLLAYFTIVQIMRMICFLATTLPDASQRAHLRSRGRSYFFGGCGDLVFSGHVAAEYGAALWMMRHRLIGVEEWWLWVLLSLVGGLFSVASRSHYSVDVLVAVPACHWAWDVYRSM